MAAVWYNVENGYIVYLQDCRTVYDRLGKGDYKNEPEDIG